MKIYFADSTFDKVTKDQKSNLMDKIANIGGTLGLFTGCSLISLYEIFYFFGKTYVVRFLNFFWKLPAVYMARRFRRNTVHVQVAEFNI